MSDSKEKVWSAEQEQVFTFVREGSGHLVVSAPAGSGKTTTVMEAVTRASALGAGDIGIFSFGREISKELVARVEEAQLPGVYVSTLHAFGRRAVTRTFPKARLNEGKSTEIADRLFDDGKDRGYKYQRGLLAKAVSVAKNQLLSGVTEIDLALERLDFSLPDYVNRPVFLRRVAAIVAASREDVASFDMDDMIWLPVVLGLKVPTFAFVFIDERQDLNKTQLELGLKGRGGHGAHRGRWGRPAGHLWVSGCGRASERVRAWSKGSELPSTSSRSRFAVPRPSLTSLAGRTLLRHLGLLKARSSRATGKCSVTSSRAATWSSRAPTRR